MNDKIQAIEKELSESRSRCSTSNKWDSAYSAGLAKALEILKQ